MVAIGEGLAFIKSTGRYYIEVCRFKAIGTPKISIQQKLLGKASLRSKTNDHQR